MTTAAEFDVVVVGSGAAGMTAALTAAHHGLSVLVTEKAGTFGGSTARSGGGLWIPGNEVLRRAGVADTAGQARSYLAHVVAGHATDARQQALLEHGPAMLDLVRRRPRWSSPGCPGTRTTTRRRRAGWPPGAASSRCRWTGGGPWDPTWPRSARPYLPAPPGVIITQRDYRWLSLGPRHPRAVATAARVAGRAARARLLRQRPLSMGQALAAGLRAGLATAGVPVWLDTPDDRPVRRGRPRHGRRGDPRRPARRDHGPARRAAGRRRIRAQRGDAAAVPARPGRRRVDHRRGRQHRRRHPRGPGGRRCPRPDGRRLVGPVHPAAVRPVLLPGRAQPARLPARQRRRAAVRQRVRALRGRRARDVRGPLGREPGHPRLADPRPALPQHVRVRGPDPGPPVPPAVVRGGRGVPRGHGRRTGLPAPGSTPRAWPRPWPGSTSSRRPATTRTSAAANRPTTATTATRASGPTRTWPRWPRRRSTRSRSCPATWAPRAACVTDERARVLRPDGSSVPGLYAAGNASAAVMGHSYAGAGATIGPAMTFGYIAALDLAGPSDMIKDH